MSARRLQWAALVILGVMLAVTTAQATTVTGTVYAGGVVIPSGRIILTLTQEGVIATPALILAYPPVPCTITNGVITACTVTGNDVISPAGTQYKIRIVSDSGAELLPTRYYTISGSTWNIGEHAPDATATVAAQAYQYVAEEGTALTRQRTLNFIGAGITCANNGTFSRTDCTLGTASATTTGALTSTDWSTFNAKQPAGSYALQSLTLTATSPITGGGDLSTNRSFGCQAASGSQAGCLSSTDWTTFNSKQAALGFTPENVANKNQASGYAGLDASSKLLATQLPAAVPTALGGVNSADCSATGHIQKINTDGSITCSANWVAPLAHWASILPTQGGGAALVHGERLSFLGTASNIPPDDSNKNMENRASAATTNSDAGWYSTSPGQWYFGRDLDGWFQVSLQDLTNVRMWIGFVYTMGTLGAYDDPTAADAAMFRFSSAAGDTNYMCYTANSTGSTVTDSGIGVSSATRTFQISVRTGHVYFAIDGAVVCDHTTTLPRGTISPSYWVALRTLANEAKNIRLGSIYIKEALP